MTKLPAGLSYESTLEHIIEHVVLNVTAPDNASADDIRIREFSKTILRLNELEPPNDAVIDEIAGELIEWHAPRPDEEGWDPDLADAPAEQRLTAWNRHRAHAAAEERKAEHEQAAQQEKFQRQREDAARRRARGDHDGADFIERWIERQERARGPTCC
jgi:hypothetical protein